MMDETWFPDDAYGLPELRALVLPMAEGQGDTTPTAVFAERCGRMCRGIITGDDRELIRGDDEGMDHGAARVILRRDIPGIGIGDIIARLKRWKGRDPAVLSPAEGSRDPSMGTNIIMGGLGGFIAMEAAGVSESSITAAATILARSGGDSLVRLPLSHDGEGLGAFLAFRAAISPDGDPLTPGFDEEWGALAPSGGRCGSMFGWMDRDGFEYDPDAPAVFSAMCRPAILGYDPSAIATPAGRHDDVRAMIASMRRIPGSYAGSVFPDPPRGILMGVTRLLAAMDGRDRDRDMALMGAAQTLTDAGVESGLRYGDYETILTGDALADAIMDGIGMPVGFVVETAMASGTGGAW